HPAPIQTLVVPLHFRDRSHLLGKETIGVYPLLPDETCWFLAADFDKQTWEYGSLAFFQDIRSLDVVRLIAIGACWGVAVAGLALLIGSKFRKG
nr:hypothetical protein [Acidobacteriota bacterium]